MGAPFSRVSKPLILKSLQAESVRTIFAQGVVPAPDATAANPQSLKGLPERSRLRIRIGHFEVPS
jgi:hypothetical protein